MAGRVAFTLRVVTSSAVAFTLASDFLSFSENLSDDADE